MPLKRADSTAAAHRDAHDDDLRSSHVRSTRRKEESGKYRRDALRDSVDRYLDDLDATERITPAQEIELADAFFVAAAECVAVAREAGIRADLDRDKGDRDTIIGSFTRLCRLLDEHEDASRDARRKGMVRMVEEELGGDAATFERIREEIARPRDKAMHARQRMTQANLALVVHVAKAYRNRGVAMADLIQEGNISLLRAVEKYDPTRGARLGTYATAWLHRSMARTIRSLSRTVRLPESAKTARSHSVPIDEPVGEGRLSLTDILCEDDAIAPDDAVSREDIRAKAREHLSSLSEQEAFVIRRRFGIEDGNAQTLREIGEVLGVTRERVRQIEKAALDRLRRRMRRLTA